MQATLQATLQVDLNQLKNFFTLQLRLTEAPQSSENHRKRKAVREMLSTILRETSKSLKQLS